MTDQWLPAIFEGTAGAVIALVGVYVAFTLTRRHDNNRDERQAALTKELQREQEVREKIAEVLSAANRTRFPGNDRTRLREDLTNSLIQLSASTSRPHPEMSEWAWEVSVLVADSSSASEADSRKSTSYWAGSATGILQLWLKDAEAMRPVLRDLTRRIRTDGLAGNGGVGDSARESAESDVTDALKRVDPERLKQLLEFIERRASSRKDVTPEPPR